ncbi:ABC transporter substrate-binding protein [Streptomyces phaeoluteigriseus]|uniref:ABC transporter substrate-binding protein n=1 Tax=Streptomyces phaeoluteigriseus TaxID=114686 RepID=A0ABY4ZCY7_9ACTN|nr:ABC transporter substrate-binding protein [Streptomyces phaeoluteigriseus]USQ86405.1 ABC transporter substrate-binding protein [Streptomyces phaeoluteigriseus]
MHAPRTALALTAVSALLTLSACTSGGATTPSAAQNLELTSTTPAASGALDEITWNLPLGEPTTLDPAKVGDYSPSTVVSNLCDPLLRLNADYSVGPGLATAWNRPDPKTLVLDLRDDVRFWNGRPMTAADVVASLERQRAAATRSVNTQVLATVRTITATGDHQVTVTFSTPDVLFLKYLVNGFGAVSEAAYLKKAGTSYGTARGGLMCTGPFELTGWKSGESITAVRNDAYWDTGLRPRAAKLTFKFLTDAGTLTSALLSGQIDGSYEIPSTVSKALRSSDTGTLYHGPSAQTVFVAPTGPTSPLADPRITQALSLVLDRDALVRNVFDGAARTEKTFIPSLVWKNSEAKDVYAKGYDALPAVPAADVTRARRLVDEADPKQRTVTVAMGAGDQQSLQILTFLQAGAKRIGLTLAIKQLQPTQMSGLFYDPSLRTGLDATMALGYVEIPDPLSYAEMFTSPASPMNWTHYDNPEVTSLLTRARATLDPEGSAQLFTRAQALYTKDLPIVPIAVPHERLFLNKRLSGAPASFAYLNMPWAAHLGATDGNAS